MLQMLILVQLAKILPSTTETYNLGSASKRWNELFLAGTTIKLGGSTISSDGTGQITISATGATLPGNSNIEVTSGVQKEIALAGETGDPVRSVPFFSKSGGLNTVNTRLDLELILKPLLLILHWQMVVD